ncbi:Diacylglycerol kinase kappa [Manis javanica]|nr:Diacylglycerol kinase kappa [Manis javanica]
MMTVEDGFPRNAGLEVIKHRSFLPLPSATLKEMNRRHRGVREKLQDRLCMFKNFACFRIVVCGGHGSVSWALSLIDVFGLHERCQLAIIPLGTGNDLAHDLSWGASWNKNKSPMNILNRVEQASVQILDRWSVMIHETPRQTPLLRGQVEMDVPRFEATAIQHLESATDELNKILKAKYPTEMSIATRFLCSTVEDFAVDIVKAWSWIKENNTTIESVILKKENRVYLCMSLTVLTRRFKERCVINNYFGIGLDAKISLEFNTRRDEHPGQYNSRLKNKMWYGLLGSKELLQRSYRKLEERVHLEMAMSCIFNLHHHRIAQCHEVIIIDGEEGIPVQVDGEAWVQRPGLIKIRYKNASQMLTRDRLDSQDSQDSLSDEEYAQMKHLVQLAENLISRLTDLSKVHQHVSVLMDSMNASANILNDIFYIQDSGNEAAASSCTPIELKDAEDEATLQTLLNVMNKEFEKLSERNWMNSVLVPEEKSYDTDKRSFRLKVKFLKLGKKKLEEEDKPESGQRIQGFIGNLWHRRNSEDETKDDDPPTSSRS